MPVKEFFASYRFIIFTCLFVLLFIILPKNVPGSLQAQDGHTPPTAGAKPAAIVFDLHGVLFEISKKRTLSRLGFMDMLLYTVSGRGRKQLEGRLFSMLHQLSGHTPDTYCPEGPAPLHAGKALPKIMCDWLQGTVTGNEIIRRLEPLVAKLDQKPFFASPLEKKIIKKIVTVMFDPTIRADLYLPLKNGIKLLKQCKAAGHRVYLLSNMDSPLIKLLDKKYPEIFNLFDGITISGDVQMIKPHANIYQHVLKTHAIDPSICYVLDDQEENIVGAKNAGLRAILFTRKTAKKARNLLVLNGILPERRTRVGEASIT